MSVVEVVSESPLHIIRQPDVVQLATIVQCVDPGSPAESKTDFMRPQGVPIVVQRVLAHETRMLTTTSPLFANRPPPPHFPSVLGNLRIGRSFFNVAQV